MNRPGRPPRLSVRPLPAATWRPAHREHRPWARPARASVPARGDADRRHRLAKA